MKKLYTEEIHAKRLTKMLKRYGNSAEYYCPASKYYDEGGDTDDMWSNDACKVCVEFIGLDHETSTCPCFETRNAIARSIKILKEHGYWDEN